MTCWTYYLHTYANLKRLDNFGDEEVADWWRREYPDERIFTDKEINVVVRNGK
jgi:hypothetical protein